MQEIEATLREGWRVASGQSTKDPRFNAAGGTIRLQIAAFKACGLDFEDYFGGKADAAFFCGTLGLDVAPQTVAIAKPEYFFAGVRWTDIFDKPELPPFRENFFLSPAQVTFKNITYKALIYIADPATKPSHHQLPSRIEVIAPKIPNISYGDMALLSYNPDAIRIVPASYP